MAKHRFGTPFDVDRACKCFECSKPMNVGEKLVWDFRTKTRWCQECAKASVESGAGKAAVPKDEYKQAPVEHVAPPVLTLKGDRQQTELDIMRGHIQTLTERQDQQQNLIDRLWDYAFKGGERIAFDPPTNEPMDLLGGN